MAKTATFLSVAVAAALAPAPASAQAPGQTLAVTPGIARATFDSAWSRINATYYDTAFLATRWVALRDSLGPIAARAKNNAELRAVIQTLISNVHASHFGLIGAELTSALGEPAVTANSAAPGDIGASLRLIGSSLVVWRADSGGAAWQRGVRPGMQVRGIDHNTVGAEMARLGEIGDSGVRRQARVTGVMRANAQLTGSVGDTVTLDVAQIASPLGIARGPVRGTVVRFGNLPPIDAIVDSYERTVNGPNGAKRVAVIAWSVWLPAVAAKIDDAFFRAREADAIVIDLRGNPGGLAAMTNGIAGHLLDSARALGTLRLRGTSLQLAANPRSVTPDGRRVGVFAGPVAIVVDGLTGSASEFFAAGLQGLGRARVFGEVSAGASLPAVLDRLPNGDILMHAIADHVDSRGRRVEGVGVIPDLVVPLTVASLVAGRDDALDAAVRWAAAQSHK